MSPPPSNALADVPPHVLTLLDDLHARSLTQEAAISKEVYADRSDPARLAALMRDKFIALDKDKCEFVYTLVRAIGAKNVVEAGTSYGVSTIYLALGVGEGGKVIATEHEPSKAAQARAHWKQAGEQVEKAIDLREGDLLQTLKTDMPQVDFLLLDIWAPMALPTLKLVTPHLRRGAIVVADNTVSHAESYAELLAVVRAPDGPFRSLILPYSNGLELSVYLP
ncbi:S-adenosyl-L-methionine-dependent methyltransferase [Auricularia subglabra TFB-10046 SS5]|nr:S-adenosyl-L-methionine-dependent methyltransferase [Auricularia subglabra TFB-10046 SS5]